MWKNKNIAEKVLARPSEWTGVKEEKKRRRGPYPLLQLCLGALLIFAAVVPENHLYRENSGQQTAQDPVVPAAQAREELEFFFSQLHAAQPGLIGGRLPEADFYYSGVTA